MEILITQFGKYKLHQFELEDEFERCVISQAESIFGTKSVYIDCKRKIGKGKVRGSIPDAYLIDFSSGQKPELFVVENEISSHDLFQHIGVQILKFAHSFSSEPRHVKHILFEEIANDKKILRVCEQYAEQYGLRNIDNMLDYLVNDTFRALIVIDKAIPELYEVVKNFQFPVKVIQVATYKKDGTEYIYRVEPLSTDINSVLKPEAQTPIKPPKSGSVSQPTSSTDDYLNKKLQIFVLFGKTYNPSNWKELLVTVSEEMYRRHSNEFDKCLSLHGTKMIYFSQHSSELKQPKQIADSRYFVETKFDANYIVKHSQDLMACFGYKESDLIVIAG
ncbi:MAG: hypothetical protein ABSB31_02495 [Dehalococcoidia bacterium]|jgi:hypothetical protein